MPLAARRRPAARAASGHPRATPGEAMSVASPPAPSTLDPPTATATPRRRRKPGGSRFPAAPWVLLPSLVLIFIFVYGFIAFSGWISVSNWNRPTRDGPDPSRAVRRHLRGDVRRAALPGRPAQQSSCSRSGSWSLALLGGLVLALLVHHVTVGQGPVPVGVPAALRAELHRHRRRVPLDLQPGAGRQRRPARDRDREPAGLDHRSHRSSAASTNPARPSRSSSGCPSR